jgi:hypothetical protein
MATNGILDITTEEYMGQDPEMQIDQDEMIEIIRTLQVIGIPQDKHPEVLEAFKEWKQTNAGTVDMFLEASLQLEPGTITKIKEQQVARGPEDIMQTEEEMTIQPGSGDMQEIMQSVGAPQRAAQGGRIGYQTGEQVLPMPRPDPDVDPRQAFFRRMGAMPDQTLLGQPQAMNAMSGQRTPQGIMSATQDPFGGLLTEGDIGQGGQPLVEYEHEGAEQPPSWWDRMLTGTHDGSLDHSLDMETIIDFLKKMGMAITKENIAKAAQALGVAMRYTPPGQIAGLGIAGLKSLGAPEEIEETETETIGFRDGGITNAVPRQGFFLGKVAKAITGGAKKVLKSAKKVLKSDLGKMAMMYIATAGFSNVAAQQGLGGAQKWGGFKWLQPGNVASNIGSAAGRVLGPLSKGTTATTAGVTEQSLSNQIRANALKKGVDPSVFWGAGEKVAENVAKPWYKNPMVTIPAAMLAGGAYTAANPGEVQFDTDKRDEEVNKWTQWLAGIPPKDDIVYPYPNYTGVAQGGRVGRQEGGIMDLGGAEKDYRNTGGFVDIGAKEKADDVPARLSVNEFVMTADAVRGAGDGDVEEGAERLQTTMKQLEQKGKRHKAAQGMFATSQRLGEVI